MSASPRPSDPPPPQAVRGKITYIECNGNSPGTCQITLHITSDNTDIAYVYAASTGQAPSGYETSSTDIISYTNMALTAWTSGGYVLVNYVMIGTQGWITGVTPSSAPDTKHP